MRYMTKTVLALVIVLLASGLVFTDDKPEPRLITVIGEAEVRVAPDEVILTLGVETIDVELKKAKDENDQRVAKIIAVAKNLGVEEKHIQTDHISIEPRYEHKYSEDRRFIGYWVRKTIVLTLRDTEKFEGLLSQVLEAGANYVHGVQFRTTELRKYKDQARALAIKAAKEKAEALAKELDQKIGQPHSIKENRASWWYGYNSWWGSRWGSGMSMSQNVIQNVGGSASGGDSIALGQIKIKANVTVSFELE